MRELIRDSDRAPRFVGAERRHALRYYVALPIDFDTGTGTTRDVSEGGVRLETDRRLAYGESVTFHLVFRDVNGGEPWRMAGTGAVVRIEPEGVGFVVALRVDGYTLAEAPSYS